MEKEFRMNSTAKIFRYIICGLIAACSFGSFVLAYKNNLLTFIFFYILKAAFIALIAIVVFPTVFFKITITKEAIRITTSPFSRSEVRIEDIERIHYYFFTSFIIMYKEDNYSMPGTTYPLENHLDFVKTIYDLKPDCWMGKKISRKLKEKYNIEVKNIATIKNLKEYYKNRKKSVT